jgi:hypothetical protein
MSHNHKDNVLQIAWLDLSLMLQLVYVRVVIQRVKAVQAHLGINARFVSRDISLMEQNAGRSV